jgi:pimeloyl-ACP methyl ester carboxylesterase
MNVHLPSRPVAITKHRDVPTKTVDVAGTKFAYRELGPETGVPVIFLTHLSAVLDNRDPRVVDGVAAKRRVITFDNRGVGASTCRLNTFAVICFSLCPDWNCQRLPGRCRGHCRDRYLNSPVDH